MTENGASKARTTPSPRQDYLNMTDLARLFHVSPPRVRQWVHGDEVLAEPVPEPRLRFKRRNGAHVLWWHVEQKPELIAWRRRCQALSSAKFLNKRPSKRGAPRQRTLDDIARAFLSEQPSAALGALAVLAFYGLESGQQLDEEQAAVADRALDLVNLIDEHVFVEGAPVDAPNDDLTKVLASVTTPRHVTVISQGGATNQIAYLLTRLSFTELTDQLCAVEVQRTQTD